MVDAYDAVILNDAVVGVKVILVAADAVVANDALTTFCAHEAVPNNEPVNDPVNEPVFVVPPAFAAYEAVIAYDAVLGVNVILVAADAVVLNDELITLLAQLLVPNSEPV